MGRKKGLFSLFPLPIVPRALSFSFSPVSLRHKEASAEEGGVRLRELTALAGKSYPATDKLSIWGIS